MSELKFVEEHAMSPESLKAKPCCKSGCIHCPHGFTLKKFGLEFSPITHEQISEVEDKFDFKMSLDDFKLEDYKIVILKDVICAVIRVDHLFAKECYIPVKFKTQGIYKEVIESYYFR